MVHLEVIHRSSNESFDSFQTAQQPPKNSSLFIFRVADWSLKVGGRHDPVIGPRAVPVVEAVAMLVICDLGICGGFLNPKSDSLNTAETLTED